MSTAELNHEAKRTVPVDRVLFPHVEVAAFTNSGLQLANKEDVFVVDDRTFSNLPEYGIHTSLGRSAALVFAVCDGMGGHEGGEIAALAAAEAVSGAERPSLTPERLVEIIKSANRQIYDLAESEDGFAGMGSTLVAAVLWPDSDGATIANVGDSRAYLIDADGQIRALTNDQADPQGNLLQAMGGQPRYMDVDVAITHPVSLGGGVLVLCSDGVSNLLSPAQLAAAFSDQHPGPLCASFPKLARLLADGGADDNVSLVAVRQSVEPVPTGQCSEVFAEAFRSLAAPDPTRPEVANRGSREP